MATKKQDAFKILRDDHKEISALLKKIMKTTSEEESTREELFEELRDALELHTEIEEEILYPALEENDETRSMAIEAMEDHADIDVILAELDSIPTDSDEWNAKIKMLHDNIEDHVDKEENEMFERARESLSKEQMDQINMRIGAKMAPVEEE